MPGRRGRSTIAKVLPVLFSQVFLFLFLLPTPVFSVEGDSTAVSAHPRLFFDSTGVDQLRDRVWSSPRLNKIWQRFKVERVDSAFNLNVTEEGVRSIDLGRAYGDALGELTVAYIVLDDSVYARKVIGMMVDLAELPSWGNFLVTAHISIGLAFAWDVLYDVIPDSLKAIIRTGVLSYADNDVSNDVQSNVNWTASAGEGLIGLAFAGDGSGGFNSFVADLLLDAKLNFEGKARSVLWGHGTDGFPHEGLGYWRKYIHIGLFFQALRFNQPDNDWFHLGKDHPLSEFLRNTGYPRIYADVQAADLATLTWGDSRQVRTKPGLGPFGNFGVLTLVASEYDDGYVMDFVDYLLDTGARFDQEDWATFLFYDDSGIASKSYTDLPLSHYWPDMEAAIFRSGWSRNDLVFFMRCGSPGGHGRFIKRLSPSGHDHPDANGFVLFFNNDYLAAEDGAFPEGTRNHITYGHNTVLVDGIGQRGDRTPKITSTEANMDFMDTEHVGYLLGDASDAYDNLSRFLRYVIYKKHQYVVMVDELEDSVPHRYDYLLGTDSRHFIVARGDGQFNVLPDSGRAELQLVVVEPANHAFSINRDRPYAMDRSMVDLLRVSPAADSQSATFFTLHYPQPVGQVLPEFEKLYFDSLKVSGLRVHADEYHLHNPVDTLFVLQNLMTNARLCYFKDSFYEFEYLASGATELLYRGRIGFRASQKIVASFRQNSGKIRVGKNAGPPEDAVITLFYPGLKRVILDGLPVSAIDTGPGWMTFAISPKRYRIGPTGDEQTVTDNYEVTIEAEPLLKIISPNGGELFAAHSTHSITWTADSLLPGLTIEQSNDGGISWNLVAADAPNTGLFEWPVPDVITAKGLIRIRNADSAQPVDVSDAVFEIDKPPDIYSFEPTLGFAGTRVVVSGHNLSKVSSVTFGGIEAERFVIVGDSLIGAVVPEGARSGPLVAVNRMGADTSSVQFRIMMVPVIKSFGPAAAPVGATITIIGCNFRNAAGVSIGEFELDGFEVEADTLLRIAVPEEAVGGRITVRNALGVGRSQESLRVQRPPSIQKLSPDSGPIGTTVSIGGRGFLDVTSVSFAEVRVDSFMIISDTLLVTVVPLLAESGRILISSELGVALSEKFFTVTSVTQVGDPEQPYGFSLSANYPNPFNGMTQIDYSLKNESRVRLVIYNLLGQRVKVLVDDERPAGRYRTDWDGQDEYGRPASTGIYILRLVADGHSFVRKLLLQK